MTEWTDWHDLHSEKIELIARAYLPPQRKRMSADGVSQH